MTRLDAAEHILNRHCKDVLEITRDMQQMRWAPLTFFENACSDINQADILAL